jgi:hypothetical protein
MRGSACSVWATLTPVSLAQPTLDTASLLEVGLHAAVTVTVIPEVTMTLQVTKQALALFKPMRRNLLLAHYSVFPARTCSK